MDILFGVINTLLVVDLLVYLLAREINGKKDNLWPFSGYYEAYKILISKAI